MKNIKYLSILFLIVCFSINSYSQKPTKKNVGERTKTLNPNIPYIYENGFSDYEVVKQATLNSKDSSAVYTLKFNAVASAMYTQKIMFDKFGKWTTAVPSKNNGFILIWENIKLFDDKEELFTIMASGRESLEEMFAAVSVFDSKNNDCLSEKSEFKKEIIDYFSNAIIHLNNDKSFYGKYKALKS